MNASSPTPDQPPRKKPFLQLGLGMLLLVVLFGGMQIPRHVTPEAHNAVAFTGPRPAQAVDGKKIYTTRCMACHQANGEGVMGVFPPLSESEWVTEDKGRLIRIILGGMSGEVEVNGVVYSGAMPPWATFLKDADVAALSTYIRTSWKNKADAVTAEEVAKVREATKARKDPWTAKDLMQPANSGIPGAK